MIFDPSPRPLGAGQKSTVARPIHVSSSHNKFGWILSNCLGGDSITDGRTDVLTFGFLVGTYSVKKVAKKA